MSPILRSKRTRSDTCSNSSSETLPDDSHGGVDRLEPQNKRVMRVDANLRLLEKIPTLRNYKRGRFGRRGAIDGGIPIGQQLMNALQETFEETSFASGEPPSRRAVVDLPHPTASSRRGMSNAQTSVASRPSYYSRITAFPTNSTRQQNEKDDETRPTSNSSN